MTTPVQEAYSKWKGQHKVDLQVRTDEQMFAIGFDACQEYINELTLLIFDLEKENKHLVSMVKKLTQDLKHAKKV